MRNILSYSFRLVLVLLLMVFFFKSDKILASEVGCSYRYPAGTGQCKNLAEDRIDCNKEKIVPFLNGRGITGNVEIFLSTHDCSGTAEDINVNPDGDNNDQPSYRYIHDPCNNLPSAGRDSCRKCMYGNTFGPGFIDDTGVEKTPIGFWTGIGCIPTNPMEAIEVLMRFLLGVSAIFVLAQILIGASKMMTARSDTKGVQDAKERITNSVIAMLFILFSVTILQFIGVDILKIPGFFDKQ